MTDIDDLDADRMGIDVAASPPTAFAGVPCALLLGHHLDDAAVLMHEIVAGHAALWIAQPTHRPLARAHPGIVEDQHVRAARQPAFGVVGRRPDLVDARGVGLQAAVFPEME